MPELIQRPAIIEAAGTMPKQIEEFVGRASSGQEGLSIARMQSPPGWEEPGQRPEFDEYTLVLKGMLRVTTPNDTIDVAAGQAIVAYSGEWVRYSTPFEDGAEYISICLPAFSPDTVNRDLA